LATVEELNPHPTKGIFGLSYEAGLGDCTAEAPRTPSKELLIKKFSDLRAGNSASLRRIFLHRKPGITNKRRASTG
jgi:hypothetical protein